jgi:hypothetical protein
MGGGMGGGRGYGDWGDDTMGGDWSAWGGSGYDDFNSFHNPTQNDFPNNMNYVPGPPPPPPAEKPDTTETTVKNVGDVVSSLLHAFTSKPASPTTESSEIDMSDVFIAMNDLEG